jgi:hypothetical protein
VAPLHTQDKETGKGGMKSCQNLGPLAELYMNIDREGLLLPLADFEQVKGKLTSKIG